MVRSQGRIERSADELYTLLISKEGYQLLDPNSNPEEFDKPFLGPFPFGSESGLSRGEDTNSSSNAKPRTICLEHATMKVCRL